MKIRGNTIGTPMKRPDFNQTDPRKSDFIRNNPIPPVSGADEGKILQVQNGKLMLTEFEGEQYTEGLEYILSDDGTYYACDGGDIPGDIKIPPKYNGLPVKEISNSAFYGDRRSYRMLTSVVIPDTVERIEYNAFGSQWSLREIIIKGIPRMNEWGVFDTAALYDIFGDGKGVVPLEIHVPFSEGEVEGAPWGSSHGTIFYNSPKSKSIEERISTLEEKVENNRLDIWSLERQIGEFGNALDELHSYAQALIGGGA